MSVFFKNTRDTVFSRFPSHNEAILPTKYKYTTETIKQTNSYEIVHNNFLDVHNN